MEALKSSYAGSLYESCALPEETEPKSKLERFQERFPNATADAIDLLMQLLQYDPTARIKTAEGLNHP